MSVFPKKRSRIRSLGAALNEKKERKKIGILFIIYEGTTCETFQKITFVFL